MARLYTGQHGEFFFFVKDELFSSENFPINSQAGKAGIEHKIRDLGTVGSFTPTYPRVRNEERRSAWERAGWKRKHSDDYPEVGDNFTANGKEADVTSGFRWRTPPIASVDIPGKWRRVGSVRNWSFSNTAETIDSTKLGDTFRQKLGGLKSITGQAQLMYYRDADDSDGPISQMLDAFRYQDSETEQGEINVLFRLHHSASGNRDYSFPALITNWSMSCAVGEVVTVDVTYESMSQNYTTGNNGM